MTDAGSNVFRACFLDPYQAGIMAEYAVNSLGAKTAAILGAGSKADSRVAGQIILTWLCTFPGCGALGFFLGKLFLFGL